MESRILPIMDTNHITNATFDEWEEEITREPDDPADATFAIYDERVRRVIDRIRSQLHEEHDPQSLARLAHFSPFHFQRIFRAMTGESLAAYIRRLRLDEATKALREGNEQIVRIALRAGFETHESFTRAFRARFGVSPSEYREKGGPEFWRDRPTRVRFNRSGAIVRADGSEKNQPMIEVALQEVPEKTIASPGAVERDSWLWLPRLLKWALKHGLLERESFEVMFIDHDDPQTWQKESGGIEPCVVVERGAAGDDAIGVRTLRGGLHAVVNCPGEVSREQVYDWMYGHWLPANHLEPADAPAYIEIPVNLADAMSAFEPVRRMEKDEIDEGDEETRSAMEAVAGLIARARFFVPVRRR